MCARLSPALLLLGAALLSACGDSSTGPTPNTTLTVTPENGQLSALGDTVRLVARTGNTATTNVDWSTLDANVASVDVNGLVRALANGTARIVGRARSGSGADTAVITVQQVAATIQLTPGRDSLLSGTVKRFSAAARDRNANALAAPVLTWTSSDSTIVAVAPDGTVSARRRGSAMIRAAAGNVNGTADVVVYVTAFSPARDTTLSGTIELAALNIPTGVTVTLSGDVRARIDGALSIAGVLAGDCRALDLRAHGAVTLSGTIRNACTQPTALPRALVIVSDTTFTVQNATLESSGTIALGNDSATITKLMTSGRDLTGRMLTPMRAARVSRSQAGPKPCPLTGARLRVNPAGSRAPQGAPFGTDGAPGGRVIYVCADDIDLRDVLMLGGDGQGGGDAQSTVTQGAKGGRGGDGGPVIIMSSTTIRFLAGFVPNQVIGGEPGDGGDATGGPITKPEATGGDAGAGNFGGITAPIIAIEPGGLELRWDVEVAKGGQASVQGDDGKHAAATPATAGVAASATGGRGADFGWHSPHPLIGDIITAPVLQGVNNIQLSIHAPTAGGDALVAGGKGGNGNALFINGADGGVMTGVGGRGGAMYFVDNRPGRSTPLPGVGGNVYFDKGQGGSGWNACVLPVMGVGGKGGPSHVDGQAGEGGESGGGLPGMPGVIFARNVLAGQAGVGGDGIPPGTGGKADKLLLGELDPVAQQAFKDGPDGIHCTWLFLMAIGVAPPDIHEQFLNIRLFNNGTMSFSPLGDGDKTNASSAVNARFTIGPITMQGPVDDNGAFAVAGSGTVQGRFGTATLTGTIQKDSTGHPIGYTAELVFGAGGELPGGQPQKYTVRATLPPSNTAQRARIRR